MTYSPARDGARRTVLAGPRAGALPPLDRFAERHIGPRRDEIRAMLEVLGYESLDQLADAVVPAAIRLEKELDLPAEVPEERALAELAAMAAKNEVFRSFIGLGYSGTLTPPVIRRNVLENPGWYTAYTPYQAEIAQGRLEALLTFQTIVADLTGLPVANASLLDEGTAAAEAMALSVAAAGKGDGAHYFVDERCHPQTIAVVKTRAEARGIRLVVGDVAEWEPEGPIAGVLVQYPDTEGAVRDYRDLCERAHDAGALVTVATDLLALTLLAPPGEWGADIAVGNSQRFGVPLGYGGPHAAFFATRDTFVRSLPGRIIGLTRDQAGEPALRMALQTREQHIRKERATSNVCTAQVLLAVVAAMYAVYHGPEGLIRIARRVHALTGRLAAGLERLGCRVVHEEYFDTLVVEVEGGSEGVLSAARERRINLRRISADRVGVALDETTKPADIADILESLALGDRVDFEAADMDGGEPEDEIGGAIPLALARTSEFLADPVFHRYRSETGILRYLKSLENRDFSLVHGMIPLGSCTMKLNATAEMIPITWDGFARLHPFAPIEQARGYLELFRQLEEGLAEITGFERISLQPNAGSQGELAGLLVIRAHHRAHGEPGRTTCLIPQSAHGTNPASAVMAGMRVVYVRTDAQGNIDVDDLRSKAEAHGPTLGAIMVTYPSTHGVFEASIRDVCAIVHEHGGQVYIDGANMNAQVGLCRPGDYGADVCHLNLHKTFCIPHGGGGPGMGPIGVAAHLAPYLPDHPLIDLPTPSAGVLPEPCGTISAAPWGSPSILPISWAYIRMMGPRGLRQATEVAILSANYIARRVAGHFELLYAGAHGLIGHECILDTRPFRQSAGIDVEDIAKRLIDYGFHAPTISFPVPGTMMVEPTESEPRAELDRFVEAMIGIREEIREIEEGAADRADNLLKNAPHTLREVTADEWLHPYSRARAAFPVPASRDHKVWPAVKRVDAAYGDRNLICTWPRDIQGGAEWRS
ncbi:MAG TPA: aminomethyl-transferring glycine dehydrogenase [Gemmatimonadota bacterium]|nr:aminomethyl-transferring glycine dehydrogenase [Gemmatimonadota bacterium]